MTALRAIAGTLRSHWLAVVVFLLLPVIHTWPMASNPGVLSRNDNGDTQLNEWIMAWVVHQLPRDPLRLFDANIFYPAKDTLAFSEPLIVPAILAAPVFWLGGSPVLAFNLALLLGFALTGLATYALVYSWTTDRPGALAAGSLFAFNTHTLTRIAHIQGIHAYGLPLALLFTDRLILQPRVSTAVGLAISMGLMAYTSGYLVVFATVMIAIALIARIAEWRHRPRAVLTAFLIATVVTVVLVVPLAIPYRRVAIEQNMVRSIESVTDYSASLTGYIAAAGRVHFSTWSARFFANPVDSFFPGVVAIILSAFALWHGIRSGTHRSRLLMVVAIGLAGFVLSLGLRTPLYGWLYAVFPPMQGLRAAARFGNLFLLAMAILAGLGLAVLRQTSPRRWLTPAAIAAVVLVNLEALRAPFEYRRFEGISRVYDVLAQETGPVVLAETPFYPPNAVFANAEYVLNSTRHWRPLMNGYSGYTPESYRRVAWTFWYFPQEHAIKAMRDAGVTHFTVNPHRFGNDAAKTIELLRQRSDVELLAIGARPGTRLYRFR
jgi:hypothetical protein